MQNPQTGWIDLHGLYATEAAMYAGIAIDAAQARGDASVKLIVGLGKHSSPDAAKIKPRVLEEMYKYVGLRELLFEVRTDDTAGIAGNCERISTQLTRAS